jgi:hypothetical protein
MKTILFAAAAGILLASAAEAKDARFQGCVQYVPTMCKGIKAGDTFYIVNTANPPIPLNSGATVTGEITDKWSPSRGKWVEVKSWKPAPRACQ